MIYVKTDDLVIFNFMVLITENNNNFRLEIFTSLFIDLAESLLILITSVPSSNLPPYTLSFILFPLSFLLLL